MVSPNGEVLVFRVWIIERVGVIAKHFVKFARRFVDRVGDLF